MSNNKERILTRDVDAVQIPAGNKIVLPAGANVKITHTLGGCYTVLTDTSIARIEGKDADALGEKVVDIPVESPTLADGAPDPEAVWAQLKKVFDPEIPVNIVDLGLVYSMDISKTDEGQGYRVDVAMTLTAPGCGMGPAIAEDAKNKVLLVPGVTTAEVRITWEPPWNQQMISEEGKMQLGLV
jgi:probable FeS assembly SUF system protein SufT